MIEYRVQNLLDSDHPSGGKTRVCRLELMNLNLTTKHSPFQATASESRTTIVCEKDRGQSKKASNADGSKAWVDAK